MPNYTFEEELCQLIIQIEQPPDYIRGLDALLRSLQFVLGNVLPGLLKLGCIKNVTIY